MTGQSSGLPRPTVLTVRYRYEPFQIEEVKGGTLVEFVEAGRGVRPKASVSLPTILRIDDAEAVKEACQRVSDEKSLVRFMDRFGPIGSRQHHYYVKDELSIFRTLRMCLDMENKEAKLFFIAKFGNVNSLQIRHATDSNERILLLPNVLSLIGWSVLFGAVAGVAFCRCGRPLISERNAKLRYCSSACKQAAYRARQKPIEGD